jgi:hypothetical protein
MNADSVPKRPAPRAPYAKENARDGKQLQKVDVTNPVP